MNLRNLPAIDWLVPACTASFSPGMPPNPSAEGASWFFDFPQADGVHYVTTNVRGSATARVAISAKFTISGSEFRPTQGDVAARVRLYLQRHGDNWSGEGEYEFFRWYSFTFVELMAGEHQLTAALLSEQWVSVMGKGGADSAAAGEFIAAVSDLGAVGLTFGGTFAGHGVYTVGPARFVLTSYIIA